MLICAFAVTPIFFAQYYDDLWVAVLVIGVATAAHQAFSANLYTLPSDLFPRSAVGSVIGIGGTVGAVGGMIFSLYTGQVLERIGSYTPIFVVAGSAYFVALAIVHLLTPRLERRGRLIRLRHSANESLPSRGVRFAGSKACRRTLLLPPRHSGGDAGRARQGRLFGDGRARHAAARARHGSDPGRRDPAADPDRAGRGRRRRLPQDLGRADARDHAARRGPRRRARLVVRRLGPVERGAGRGRRDLGAVRPLPPLGRARRPDRRLLAIRPPGSAPCSASPPASPARSPMPAARLSRCG